MFLGLTHYSRSLVLGEDVLLERFAYLDGLYEGDLLAASGPRSGPGGVLVMPGTDEAPARELVAADPLAREGVVTFTLVGFAATCAANVRFVEVPESPSTTRAPSGKLVNSYLELLHGL